MKTLWNTRDVLSRLTFRHLQLLQTVAAAGSLSAAAQELHKTQSALSKALREIEDMLGLTVFERVHGGLRISERGQIVVQGACLLIAELRHLCREAHEGRGQAVLRLGTPPFVALTLLPPALQKLLRRDPPVLVLLTEQRVSQLHHLLLAGELDALLTTYAAEPAASASRDRLRYEKLFDADVVVIAACDWKTPRTATWSRLAAEAWILPEKASYIRRLAEDMFLREGVAVPRPVVESTNPLTTVQLVAQGLGLAVVPAPAAEEAEKAKRIRRVNVTPRMPTAPIALVYRLEAQNHPRIAVLRTALGVKRQEVVTGLGQATGRVEPLMP